MTRFYVESISINYPSMESTPLHFAPKQREASLFFLRLFLEVLWHDPRDASCWAQRRPDWTGQTGRCTANTRDRKPEYARLRSKYEYHTPRAHVHIFRHCHVYVSVSVPPQYLPGLRYLSCYLGSIPSTRWGGYPLHTVAAVAVVVVT